MGITERKEREKDDMRKLIMDAAFEMFLKEGYAGTSLRLIAKKIEYSPGTIYLYYKDKDALFFDIQTRCFDNLVTEYKKLEGIEDPFERLKQIGHTYMRHNIENPQCFNIKFLLDSPLGEFTRKNRWAKYGNALGFFTYTVKECVDQKLIDYIDVDKASLELWGIVHGLTTLFNKKSYMGLGLTEDIAKEYMKTAYNDFLKRIKT
ncbi:MAG: TetR/AcrR family transcriptional regulator [Sphingobacteriaceae bacterium]|nr:TetR/AcrR family transcriptional regulator [Sphingobacteriaceae bacterium]